MRSVFYRGTGRFINAGQKPDSKAGEIVRNNEIFTPEFLGHTNGRSLFKNGDRNNGIDERLNAVGDSADIATSRSSTRSPPPTTFLWSLVTVPLLRTS
jgi:hypothetical protein